jgi:steroid 5-alpha reductase family enzyme
VRSPLEIALYACAALAAIAWLMSIVTREYSWVDRLWSLAPPGYVLWYASVADFADPRLLVMSLLAVAWGARLTFNFARKGGYAPGGEDYRWLELQRRMPRWAFHLFNPLFIAGFQNLLLFLIAVPAWVALEHRHTPFGWIDALAAGAFALFLVGETVADEQQWRFHQAKKARVARGEPVAKPFLSSGLFRLSRHPNFFCEQAMWWCFYLFAVAASGQWLSPWLAGPVLLTALFQGSTRFTEELSLAKYPSYASYQRRVSRLLPWWPRPAGDP